MSETVAGSVERGVDPRPYAPAWLHLAVAWVERLPGPTWIAFLVLFLAIMLFWNLILWSQGKVPWGTLDPSSFYWGFLAPALLWIAGYLERGAAASFQAFRSALLLSPDGVEQLRHALTVLPARPALVLTAVALLLTIVAVVSDPATYTTNVPVPLIVGEILIQCLLVSMLFQVLYWLVRQMTIVRRTLADSVAIDVFRPAPLHAFATLTSRPGIAISVLVGVGVLITPIPSDFGMFLVNSAPYLVVTPLIALVAFVLPLTGAHARLVDQKERLQEAAELRLEAMLGDLNRNVDARDLASADALNKTLASLVLQREVLAKLPTWPWSTTTLRGFASALLLPMVLFLLQQTISGLV